MKIRMLLCALCAVVGISFLTGCKSDPTPTEKELALCIKSINRKEQRKFFKRECVGITEVSEMPPLKSIPRDVAKLISFAPGKEAKRYKCTIKWKDGTTSEGVFLRQGKKYAVVSKDWFAN